MIITRNSDLQVVAQKITCDSELFGDEVMSVLSELASLVRDAEEYGCEFTRQVGDWWGGSVSVTAVPSHRNHSWVF